jgi:hypothetical protein
MTPAAVGSTVETKRMWTHGPLRLWSIVRVGGCRIPLANGGFGGAYVCEACLVPVAGVYRVIDGVQRQQSWLCAMCKSREK